MDIGELEKLLGGWSNLKSKLNKSVVDMLEAIPKDIKK